MNFISTNLHLTTKSKLESIFGMISSVEAEFNKKKSLKIIL